MPAFGLQLGRGYSAAETFRVVVSNGSFEPSIGPRLFSRGDVDAALVRLGQAFLQLGRGYSAAETAPRAAERPKGNLPSIGPRLFSRGDCVSTTRITTGRRLQLGRGYSAAET